MFYNDEMQLPQESGGRDLNTEYIVLHLLLHAGHHVACSSDLRCAIQALMSSLTARHVISWTITGKHAQGRGSSWPTSLTERLLNP